MNGKSNGKTYYYYKKSKIIGEGLNKVKLFLYYTK